MKLIKLILVLALCLTLCACSAIPVEKLLDVAPPTAVPVLPTPQPDYPAPASAIAYSLEVTTNAGTALVLQDASAARLLLDASINPALGVKDASCAFPHKVEIYNDTGTLVKTLHLANDGCLMAQDAEGHAFRVPQYVWAKIDTALWDELDALWDEPWVWDPETSGNAALQIRLPYLLNTILAARLGYADGYFSDYELYEVKVEDHQVYLYLLGVQLAYREEGDAFREVYRQGLPIRLTLDEVEDNAWRLSGYRQADFSDGVSKAAVRAVFSYENTATAMEDLHDLSPYLSSIKMQVRSFMLSHGFSHLHMES